MKHLACISNEDCQDYETCSNNKCIDECADSTACQEGYMCKVVNHNAACVGKFIYDYTHTHTHTYISLFVVDLPVTEI